MKTRARLAAGALTTVALLGGTVACSGEAPEISQDEEQEAPNNVDTDPGEDDEQEEIGD